MLIKSRQTYLDAEGKLSVHQLQSYLWAMVYKEFREQNNPYRKHNCFRLLSVPQSSLHFFRVPEFLRFPIAIAGIVMPRVYNWDYNSYFRKQINFHFSLSLPIHSHFPTNFNSTWNPKNATEFKKNIETDLVECGKTVFIDYSSALEVEHAFLSKHYPWHKFYNGKQILHSKSDGLVFRGVGISKVPAYNRYLVEAGIFGRLWYELNNRLNLGRKPAANASAGGFKKHKETDIYVGLEGAIQTFFIIWGTAMALALAMFVFEMRHRIYLGCRLIVYSIFVTSWKIIKNECFRRIKKRRKLGRKACAK